MNRAFVCAAVAALVAGAGSAFGSVDINGGTSWGGWTSVGNSLSLGIYAGGNVNRDFDIYVTQFTFNNDTVSGSPIQAGPGYAGFSNGPGPLGFGNYAAGSFANGNTIFAIGMKMRNGSRASGNQFVNFDLDGAQFTASTVVNEARADGVWDCFGPAGQVGDFSVWMDAVNNRPSNLGVNNNGAGGVSNLPGGIGSGTGYNYAFRHFRQGDVDGSIQMFFDLTGMQAMYGVGVASKISSVSLRRSTADAQARARAGPDRPAATIPPTVPPAPKRGGSNARCWPPPARTASTSVRGVPASAVITSSVGS
jgi:hypothetical protein